MSQLAQKLIQLVNEADIVQKEFNDLLLKGKKDGQNVNGCFGVKHESLLIFLARKDLTNHMKAIIESNIDFDVNERSKFGQTALHEASSDKCISMLLQAGADVNAKDAFNATPLLSIVYNQTEENHCAVQMLVSAGADPTRKNGCDVTPLHRARTRSAIRQLLQLGADINAVNSCGQTPLMELVTLPDVKNRAALARFLIDAGADASDHRRDMNGFTTVGTIVRLWRNCGDTQQMEQFLTALLVAGVPFDCKRNHRWSHKTPFVKRWCVDSVRFLMTIGVVPNQPDIELLTSMPERKEVLSTIVTVHPNMIEWVDDEQLRNFLNDKANIENKSSQLKDVDKRWKQFVFERCAKRVFELAMIFVQLPVLVVAEICCFEQKYLTVVEEYRVWQLISSVRKLTAR